MTRNYIFLLFLLTLIFGKGTAQEFKIQKGRVVDSLMVGDSTNQSFALYLPRNFEVKGQWPVAFVFDTKGQGKKSLVRLRLAAEKRGYILASSNNIHDSISLADNMITAKRLMDRVATLFPIDRSRIYTAGYKTSGPFANLAPLFIKEIEGALSIGSSIANVSLLSKSNPFYFVSIMDRNDFNYTYLRRDEKVLNNVKFPNNLLIYDEGGVVPPSSYVEDALLLFDLAAMAKGNLEKDSTLIEGTYQQHMTKIRELQKNKKMLLAERGMREALTVYRTLRNTDSLKNAHKDFKKDKLYRSLKRMRSAAIFKENLLKEDYTYYLEEDVLTYNFKNLGWWNFQMTKINGFITGESVVEQRMGKRLLGYLNALIEDTIILEKAEKVVDQDAVTFLWMLKTITEPEQFDNYLKVVSISAKNEDYGTALFYLEEALKNGFKDKEKLYSIEDTALFRITPEFNALVKKYLDVSRYEGIKE